MLIESLAAEEAPSGGSIVVAKMFLSVKHITLGASVRCLTRFTFSMELNKLVTGKRGFEI